MRRKTIIMTSLKKMNKNKVILGLSGGVDSTTAALLLKDKGYDVTGLYFDIHDEASSTYKPLRERAEKAAEQLGIGFIYRNVADMFDDIVIGNFCREYACGHTPNPCIVCNPDVKFRTLLDAADETGAYHIATGHYADTFYDEASGLWHIKMAANRRKDQSYMLYRLGQEAISRLMLPLNEVEDKEEVRKLARSKALENADAKDSQEICFIDSDDNYKDFLARRGVKPQEGDFIDAAGNILGRHKGITHYTIGQRKGLGIALGKPAFVTAINSSTNEVVLGSNDDLFTTTVVSAQNILMGQDTATCGDQAMKYSGMEVTAKIRYASKPAAAHINIDSSGSITTEFAEPQRAVTPGQSVVFYKDDILVGGGFIVWEKPAVKQISG